MDKQQKLNQKLNRMKDQYITDVINLTQRLVNEIQEIQAEAKDNQKETQYAQKNKKDK